MVEHPFPTTIDKAEINAFPQIQFEGKIHLIDTPERIAPAIKCLNEEPYLGFDTETRPSFQKGRRFSVSLLQLSTADEAFLFRLNAIHFPEKLKQILEKATPLKLGVALHDDIRTLQRLSAFEPQGFVDFSQIAKKLGFKNLGLRSLVGIFLGFRISKGARLSNWESQELTAAQLNYAATDAWICREMYMCLLKAGLSEEILRDASSRPLPKKRGTQKEH